MHFPEGMPLPAASSSSWIPRRYHEQQVVALETRCNQAETALEDLLLFIDPGILSRNGHDWLRAVQELIPTPAPEPRKKVKK